MKIEYLLDYRVFDEEGRLLVTGHTVHACMNSDHKPTKVPSRLGEIAQLQA